MNPDRQPSPNPQPAAPGAIPPPIAQKRSSRGSKLILLLGLVALLLLTTRSWFAPEQPPPQAPSPRWNPQDPRPRQFPGVPPPARQPIAQKSKVAKPEKVSGPRAAPPRFVTPGGVFAEPVAVELQASSAQAQIRYTLDGSEPTAGSPGYAEPIEIGSTTLVKAKAFEPGVAPSPTVTQTYTLLDRTLAGFDSNLPLVVLNTFGQQVGKEESIEVSLRVIDPGPGRGNLTSPALFDGRCDIKLRGYSSLRNPKRSFTVKLRDDSGEALNASILGMPKDSEWVLYAPYSDKTLMRDVLAYELSNRMGRYAARTRFVEVFVDRQGGKLARRDYMGVYVFEEKIKLAEDRVNIQKLTPDDNAEPEVTGGYIFKRDHANGPMEGPWGFTPSMGEAGFVTSRGLQLFYVEPKEIEITSAQKNYLKKYLNQMEKSIYGPNFKSPTEGYAKYLDVDSFIDQFWIVELSKNVDGFRYSCYMFKDRAGKVRVEPIWDWNLSFGNANYHQGWMTERWYWRLLREQEVSWFRRLSQDPEFMQRVIDRWAELRRAVFKPEAILRRVDELAARLEEAQARNFQRWPILGQSVNPNWYVGDTFEDEVNWMKAWIEERIAWIDRQFVPPPAVSRTKDAPGRNSHLSLTAETGEIYYTTDGSDPRAPGGEISASAQPYREPFPLPEGGRLFARTRSGENWSGPAGF